MNETGRGGHELRARQSQRVVVPGIKGSHSLTFLPMLKLCFFLTLCLASVLANSPLICGVREKRRLFRGVTRSLHCTQEARYFDEKWQDMEVDWAHSISINDEVIFALNADGSLFANTLEERTGRFFLLQGTAQEAWTMVGQRQFRQVSFDGVTLCGVTKDHDEALCTLNGAQLVTGVEQPDWIPLSAGHFTEIAVNGDHAFGVNENGVWYNNCPSGGQPWTLLPHPHDTRPMTKITFDGEWLCGVSSHHHIYCAHGSVIENQDNLTWKNVGRWANDVCIRQGQLYRTTRGNNKLKRKTLDENLDGGRWRRSYGVRMTTCDLSHD